MIQQIHGTLDLKYSEETFRELYEALTFIIDNFNAGGMEGFMKAMNSGMPMAQQVRAKAEGKEYNGEYHHHN